MKKRILVISNTIDAGGAETFVMKVFRCLDKDKYCFDFLINKKDSTFYLEEIKKLGGSVYYGYPKSRHPIKSFFTIFKTVRSGKYRHVFCIAVHPMGFLDLLAAKLGGARVRLVRSTNSCSGGRLSEIAAVLARPCVRLFSTVMLAPSREAGIWLFGKRAVDNGDVRIITNGIDVSQYRFDCNARRQIRKELGIQEEALVVGHIGRFSRQKNHKKLLEIFQEIKKHRTDAFLVLVGEGELKEAVSDQVKRFGLMDAVKFLGIRGDVPKLLMAFDLLIFPSLYEGMPNVVIEAQATSLPCIISDTISKDVKITGRVKFLSLESENKEWAEQALEAIGISRLDMTEEIIQKGYSINETAQYLSRCFDREK